MHTGRRRAPGRGRGRAAAGRETTNGAAAAARRPALTSGEQRNSGQHGQRLWKYKRSLALGPRLGRWRRYNPSHGHTSPADTSGALIMKRYKITSDLLKSYYKTMLLAVYLD